jgi:hypothetical protein
MSANNLVLLLTVALLFWMGISVMAAIALLVLKHNTPIDARFVRGLFNVSYTAVIALALVGAAVQAYGAYWDNVARLLALALCDALLRRWLLSRMDRLRLLGQPQARFDKRGFRRLHLIGIAVNVCQVVVPLLCLMSLKI